jgi:hypothetical protein
MHTAVCLHGDVTTVYCQVVKETALTEYSWLGAYSRATQFWALVLKKKTCNDDGSKSCTVIGENQAGRDSKQSPWPESASELYRPSDRHLSAKLVPTFAGIGCHVVSVTDLYDRVLGFLDRSRYFFFQVAPQLYSRGWVDPVPDPLLLRKSGSAGNGTRTSGYVARNSYN